MKNHPSYQEPENHNLNEKRQSTDINTKMNQMLELSDKDFNAASQKCFNKQLQHLLKQMKKIENLSKGKTSYTKEPNKL